MNALVTIFAAYATIVGLCVGSFLNVCISRMPEDLSVVSPGSRCPVCGTAIRWYDNIPIVSWLVLRARCRDCGTPISALYPAVELLGGLLGLALYLRLVHDVGDLDLAHAAAFTFYLAFIAALIAETYIDLRYHIIPDELSIYAVPVGILGSFLLEQLGYDAAIGWQQSVLGALAGGGSFLAMGMLWRWLRGVEALGLGDVKLMAFIGSVLGIYPAMVWVVLVSSLLGTFFGVASMLVQRKGLRLAFPFGPSLAIAAVAYLLEGPREPLDFVLGMR